VNLGTCSFWIACKETTESNDGLLTAEVRPTDSARARHKCFTPEMFLNVNGNKIYGCSFKSVTILKHMSIITQKRLRLLVFGCNEEAAIV